VIFLYFARGYAFSEIFYVAKTGSDSNSGSKTAPFLTIQKAINSLKGSGDEILISPGDYYESLVAEVSPTKTLIKIKPFSQGVNVISSADKPALFLKYADSWSIEGISFSGGKPAVISVYASNNSSIENCKITGGSAGAPIPNGISILSSPKFVIKNNKIDVFCGNSLNLSNSKELLVRGNDISNAKSNIITFSKGCDYTIIEENYLHDKIAPGENENTIIECRDNVGSVIRRNLIVEQKEKAFLNAILIRGPYVASQNIIVENNTLIGGKTSRGISFAANTISSICRNNIIVGYGISIASVFGNTVLPQPGVKVNYNDFYNQAIGAVDDKLALFNIGNENIYVDPVFAGLNDYRLKSNSPCIDKGDPSCPVPKGGGTRVDIGRYEFIK